jgi:hypothetical protein
MAGGTTVAELGGVKRKAKRRYFTSHSPSVVSFALLGLGFAGVMAITSVAPLWKIGRAVIEWRTPISGQPAPAAGTAVLKVSLRNEGGKGSLPVQIFGRWVIQSAPPLSFVLLSTYQQEVTLTQTAILEAPLTALRTAPSEKAVLEVLVATGGKETDRKWVSWN